LDDGLAGRDQRNLSSVEEEIVAGEVVSLIIAGAVGGAMKQSGLGTAAIAIALSVGCSAQDKIAVIIRVTDPSGAPLAGANVWLRANTTASRPALIAPTTKQPAGDFTTSLRPGTYDIFVSAACLVPMATQVKVSNTGRQAVDIKMKHSTL
jgi:hypothetical protein